MLRLPSRSVPIAALAAVAVLDLLAGTACGGGAGGAAVERTDSAGIEIVTSGAAARPLEWMLAPRFALGGEPEGPGSFYRVVPHRVGADGDGRIHVLNAGESRVEVFDPDGAFLRSMGSEGGGPGELRQPGALAVTRGGTVSVFDYGKGALVLWDSAGGVLPQRPFPHFPQSFYMSRHHALTPDGYLVATSALVNDERTARLIRVSGSDTTRLAAAPQPDRGYIRFDRCGGALNFPPLFTAGIPWDHRDGVTAVALGDEYRVELWRDGRPFRSIRRPLPVTAATRELAIAEAGDGFTINFGRGPCTVPAAEYADARGWAETVPAIRAVALAPVGGVWVQRWVPGADPMPVDVFDPDGAYRGTLPDGTPFPALFLPDRRVGFVRTDDLDVMRLVVADLNTDPE